MATIKRQLDFHTGDEVIAEIELLRADGYTKTKNWNLTQACEHLQGTMNGGMNGFGFRLPWILRATVMKWLFGWMLRKRKMISGPTMKRLKPASPADHDVDQVVDDCIQTIRNAESFAGPIKDYPMLDHLSADDWRQFMWLHAAHHLEFLTPKKRAS